MPSSTVSLIDKDEPACIVFATVILYVNLLIFSTYISLKVKQIYNNRVKYLVTLRQQIEHSHSYADVVLLLLLDEFIQQGAVDISPDIGVLYSHSYH